MSTIDVVSIRVFAPAARTASVNSDLINAGRFNEAILLLDVTANSGTGQTLDIRIQTADEDLPGAGDWFDTGDNFAQVTTVNGRQIRKITNFGKNIRAVVTIAGTSPSYTFELTGIFKT